MTRRVFVMVAVLVTVLLVPAPAGAGGEGLSTLPYSFSTPVLVTAPEGDDRLFVVELGGRIRMVDDGVISTFADLGGFISTGGERGLLGLAFSPDFDSDGRLWVSYTDTGGDSRVDRFEVNGAGTAVDLSTRTKVLQVAQPASNHNGGMIAFADDGMLLVGLGDGGGGGDPFENGQDTSTLLGAILRLDVKDRGGSGYGIPSDNPFVGKSGRDEIWAYGLRNPWRFSVDGKNGDVWIGDVGQGAREEVDRLAYDADAGSNLGWDRWEGSTCFESCGSTAGLTFPVHEYSHADGRCSITGGYVVRTPGAVSLAGTYVFSDFCGGGVRIYDPATDKVRLLDGGGSIGSVFGSGQDGLGHVYVTTSNRIHRVVDSGTRFRDVAATDTFANDILALSDAGVTRGCNPPANDRFCPRDLVTREQMAAFITRAAAYTRQKEPFVDVPDDDVFAGDIGAIAAAGVTRGCNPPTNNRFCPDDVVSRKEMAAFLARALGLPRQAESFTDVAADDTFARDIGAIAAKGITRGCNPPDNDRFCPDAPVTREQMAAFVVRAFDL